MALATASLTATLNPALLCNIASGHMSFVREQGRIDRDRSHGFILRRQTDPASDGRILPSFVAPSTKLASSGSNDPPKPPSATGRL